MVLQKKLKLSTIECGKVDKNEEKISKSINYSFKNVIK